MSRRTALPKLVNLEAAMPAVDEARLRMEHEFALARSEHCVAVKLIHGYGSSGVGGALRQQLQAELRRAQQEGRIRRFIAGEDWRISDAATWELLKRYPQWKSDRDLGRQNKGISIVILQTRILDLCPADPFCVLSPQKRLNYISLRGARAAQTPAKATSRSSSESQN